MNNIKAMIAIELLMCWATQGLAQPTRARFIAVLLLDLSGCAATLPDNNGNVLPKYQLA